MTDLSAVSVISDKDYLKIFDDGPINISTVGGGDPDADPTATESGSFTVYHNINVTPLVRGFIDSAKNNVFHNTIEDGLLDPWLTIASNPGSTKFIVNSFSSQTDVPVFFRLYDLGSYAVDSDNRIDKVFATGQFTDSVPASGSSVTTNMTIVTIPHNTGAVPCYTIQFADQNTNNWTNGGSRILGPPDTSSGPPGGPYSFYYYKLAYAYADSNNLYVALRSNHPSIQAFDVRYAMDFRV